MTCTNSKDFCLEFVSQTILKNETHTATWEDDLPMEEQMHSPFSALAPALPLMETLEREPRNWGEQAGTSPSHPPSAHGDRDVSGH